jgi:hypothetical protein
MTVLLLCQSMRLTERYLRLDVRYLQRRLPGRLDLENLALHLRHMPQVSVTP